MGVLFGGVDLGDFVLGVLCGVGLMVVFFDGRLGPVA